MRGKYLLIGAGVAVGVFMFMKSRQQVQAVQASAAGIVDTTGQSWALTLGKNGFYYDNQGRMWT